MLVTIRIISTKLSKCMHLPQAGCQVAVVARKELLKQLVAVVDPIYMIGNSSQTNLLSKLLQQSEQRQQAVSQNIANLNTPGYHALHVQFEDFLENTDSAVISGRLEELSGLVEREDGNNVDLDRELGELTKNSIEFETFSHLLVARISLFRSAITGQ